MEWKTWAVFLGISMLVLALIGLIVHGDPRLIGADVLGGAAAMAVVLMANRGRTSAIAVPILAAVALLVMALSAVTSHHSPVLTALTLAFAFAFAFVSWTAMSTGRRGPTDDRRPRPV